MYWKWANTGKQVGMQYTQKTVLEVLQSGTAYHNSSISIGWGDREGVLHLRNGAIVAAEAEPLSGNGAALEISRWQDFTITEFEGDTVIRKNVTLSLQEIQEIFERFSLSGNSDSSFDDMAALDHAVLLIHQFRYAEAGKLLTELLKHNRFNYLAWLWYSRLLKKGSSVKKALDEANRWGDHDPDVWLEVKKAGVGMANSHGEDVKRCLFCWTPLNASDAKCCYCQALQSIKRGALSKGLKKVELKKAINRYINGLKEDKTNSRTGYALAVAFYNLGIYDKAIRYIEFINKLVPGKALYYNASEILSALVSTQKKVAGKEKKKPSAPRKEVKKPVVVPDVEDGRPVILVVEDSPTARKVISVVLKREGFAIVEAGSGEEALEVASQTRPGLVLLDVMLPDMTGYDVLPGLRELEHLVETPVIMLTGRKGSADKMKGLLAGSAEYLTKPFDPKKLTGVIRKYI